MVLPNACEALTPIGALSLWAVAVAPAGGYCGGWGCDRVNCCRAVGSLLLLLLVVGAGVGAQVVRCWGDTAH